MYRTGNQIPSNDMRDLSDNAEILDQIVNSPEPTVKNRVGKSVKTAKGIADDMQAVLKTGNVASVNGKKGAVELTSKDIGAVDAEQITAVLQREMHRNIYVDNINGSDSNTGFEKSKPCKTFHQASKNMIAGGAYVIYLLSDYDFVTTNPRTVFVNNNITIRGENSSDKKRIKFHGFRGRTASSENAYYTHGINCRGQCSLEFFALIIELPDIPADHQAGRNYGYWASCIISEWGVQNAIQFGIKLTKTDIVVPNPEKNEFNLVGNTGGMVNLCVAGSTMPSLWRDRNKIFAESKTTEYSISRYRVNTQNAFNPDQNTYNNGIVKG